MKRLSMRKIRHVLRVSAEGLSTRKIGASLAIGRTTLQGYLDRARDAKVVWPLPSAMSDTDLERLIFPQTARNVSNRATQPEWARIHRELRLKGALCVMEVVCCSPFLYFSGGRGRTMIYDTHWNEDLLC